MGERWCTVSVTDPSGRRYSVDVLATSVFDAAHICVAHAKATPRAGFPPLTVETLFEVVIDGKVYRVAGKRAHGLRTFSRALGELKLSTVDSKCPLAVP
jgi:hypothetical protein